MSKIKNDISILKPKPLKEFASEKILYIPVDSSSLIIQKHLKEISFCEKIFPFGSLYRLKNKTVLCQCVGAPLAVLSLERLIASGAKDIILLGFCGSLRSHAKILDAVSVTKALSEEGTSKHYFPKRKVFYPSSSLRKRIESSLCDLKGGFHTGAIVSTDAPFRETINWLGQKQRRGIDYVDMETSAVFALAEFHNIRAAALMIISDELTHSKWRTGFRQMKMNASIRKLFWPFIQ